MIPSNDETYSLCGGPGYILFILFFFTLILFETPGCSKSADEKKVCRLVDSAVDGMEYIVEGGRGLTKKGEFEYHEGDTVSFYVGGIKIGRTIPCKEILSIVDLGPSGNSSPDNRSVINMARFLQSIDDDGVPDNGITITPDLRAHIQQLGISAIDFSQTEDDFSKDIQVLAIMRKLTEITAPWRPFTRYPEGSYVNPAEHVLQENSDSALYVFKAVKPPGTNASGEYEPLFHLSASAEIEGWIKETYAIETLPLKEGDKGYQAYAYYKETIITDNGETYWRDSEIYWQKSRRDIVSGEKALSHLRKTLAAYNLSSIIFINLGDGLTAGAQNGESLIHENTQKHSWPAMVASKLEKASSLVWSNPLIRYDTLNGTGSTASGYELLNDLNLPYNVAVDGATTESLISQAYESLYMAAIYQPLNAIFAAEGDAGVLTQLQAAISIASLHPGREKIITLWIGMNDIYERIRIEAGGKLSSDSLKTGELADQAFVITLKENLSLIFEALTAIENAHLFIANIPGISDMGMLIDQTDIQSFYTKSTGKTDAAPLTGMEEDRYIGLKPFAEKIAPYLDEEGALLSARIDEVLSNDDDSLTTAEAALLIAVIDELNSFIKEYADTHDRAILVDLNGLFNQSYLSEITMEQPEGNETVKITSSWGGGLYSLDGYSFSDTGYAIIADAFIDAINQSAIGVSLEEIDAADMNEIWRDDAYRDLDQDGFPLGPEKDNLIDPFYFKLIDCDDLVKEILGPVFTGEDACI